jgi:transcriptional regulator with XRE-family HTH domain
LIKKNYIQKINELLSKNNWTQNDLAEKINKSRTTINNYLTGKTIIDIETFIDIAKAFSLPIGYFLNEDLKRENSDEKEINENEKVIFNKKNDSVVEVCINCAIKQKEIDRLDEYINNQKIMIDTLISENKRLHFQIEEPFSKAG